MDIQKLGERISLLRKQKGLSQKELAERLHVSSSAVSKWENGKNSPDFVIIKNLADIFQMSCDELLCVDESMALGKEDALTEDLETVEASKEKYKYKKWILFCGIFLCIIVISGIVFYKYEHPVFQVVAERDEEDARYGEVHELAVVWPRKTTVEEMTDYLKQIKTKWEAGELGDFDAEVLKISYYNSRTDAVNWEETEEVSYSFKISE